MRPELPKPKPAYVYQDFPRCMYPGTDLLAKGIIRTTEAKSAEQQVTLESQGYQTTTAVLPVVAHTDTKEEALASVLVAVREVVNGRTYLSPGMASDVIANVVLSKTRPGATLTDQLTDRELEILERIGRGEEVKSIADALHLSPKTIETHRAHIKEKLHLKNAREVARFAVQWTTARGV